MQMEIGLCHDFVSIQAMPGPRKNHDTTLSKLGHLLFPGLQYSLHPRKHMDVLPPLMRSLQCRVFWRVCCCGARALVPEMRHVCGAIACGGPLFQEIREQAHYVFPWLVGVPEIGQQPQ